MKKDFYCRLVLLTCLWGAYAESSMACKVPVFKYAMDYWSPEPYSATVFHKGPLPTAEKALVDSLKSKSGSTVNLRVVTTDVSNETDSAKNYVWSTQKNPKLPWVTVEYHRTYETKSGIEGTQFLGTGPFQSDTIKRLFDSPAKQELIRRLLNGDSIVWLFLLGENSEENAEAASLLQTQLKELKKTVKLPEEDKPGTKNPAAASAPTTDENIKIAFTLLTISRKDPAERVFVSQLLNLKKGLAETKGPIAFPVFGRGRVMNQLVGKEITQAKIAEITNFLCGECSCTVKSQNEGIDLALTATWPSLKQGKFSENPSDEGSESALPLVGKLSAPPPSYLRSKAGNLTGQVQGQPEENRLKLNLAISIITIIGAVICATFLIRRKGPR